MSKFFKDIEDIEESKLSRTSKTHILESKLLKTELVIAIKKLVELHNIRINLWELNSDVRIPPVEKGCISISLQIIDSLIITQSIKIETFKKK